MPRAIVANPVGAPLSYKAVRLPEILSAVKRVKGSLGQAAALCRIPKNTFRDWVNVGDLHADANNGSILHELSVSVREVQAQCVEELIELGLKGEKHNGKFIQWLLATTHRADYGLDGSLLEALLEKAQQMEQALGRIDAHPAQGVLEHDKGE